VRQIRILIRFELAESRAKKVFSYGVFISPMDDLLFDCSSRWPKERLKKVNFAAKLAFGYVLHWQDTALCE
jgi:hypothetical protein